MNIEESNLTFVFPKDIIVSKFDDGRFYRKSFGKMPGGKGVDIIADSGDMLQLIEIKNCKGHEQENRWRTSVDNSKVKSFHLIGISSSSIISITEISSNCRF